uniref:Uncharacterized protein n=1 Tax=Anguilla anguilla TaxID=7936 RepID=A0A0E9WMA4_ANGAN
MLGSWPLEGLHEGVKYVIVRSSHLFTASNHLFTSLAALIQSSHLYISNPIMMIKIISN